MNEYGRVTKYDTFKTEIYYYKEKVLYMSSYKYLKIQGSKQEDVKDINYAFVCTKDKKYGYLLDKLKSENWIMVNADSMVKKEWSSKIDLSSNMKKAVLKEIYKKGRADSGMMEIAYQFNSNLDTTYSGTIIYSFTNNLEDIPYSLNSELEKQHKLKLCKVFIKINAREIPGNNFKIDSIDQFYLVENISLSTEKRTIIMNYFNR